MSFIIQNLYLILIIGAVLCIGGLWLLWVTGLLLRILDWLRPNSDKSIATKLFCEDKQIRDRRQKIGRYVISDMKKRRSFYLVHTLLLTGPLGKGRFLALTERNARPIDFHSKVSKEEWAKYPSALRVFIDTTADIKSESAAQAANAMMAQSLSIMALAAAVIVVIFGIIVFFQTRGQAGAESAVIMRGLLNG